MSFEAPKTSDLPPSVIIDIGTEYTKIGWSNEQLPAHVFPTVVGRGRIVCDVTPEGQFWIGQEAMDLRAVLLIKFPVEFGIVTNWEYWEMVVKYCYKLLDVSPENQAVILVEPNNNPRMNREKAIQILFEELNIPALYLASQGGLSVAGVGLSTGLAVNMGSGALSAVATYEKASLECIANRPSLWSRQFPDYLMELLKNRGYSLTTTKQRSILQTYLCKYGLVAPSIEEGKSIPDLKVTFKVEDDEITMAEERFMVYEGLWKPSLLGMECMAFHEQIEHTIRRADPSIRKELWRSIVICGGASMMPGFAGRLKSELEKLDIEYPIEIIAHDHRNVLAFIGATQVAKRENFINALFIRADYDENGPSWGRRLFFE